MLESYNFKCDLKMTIFACESRHATALAFIGIFFKSYIRALSNYVNMYTFDCHITDINYTQLIKSNKNVASDSPHACEGQ